MTRDELMKAGRLKTWFCGTCRCVVETDGPPETATVPVTVVQVCAFHAALDTRAMKPGDARDVAAAAHLDAIRVHNRALSASYAALEASLALSPGTVAELRGGGTEYFYDDKGQPTLVAPEGMSSGALATVVAAAGASFTVVREAPKRPDPVSVDGVAVDVGAVDADIDLP